MLKSIYVTPTTHPELYSNEFNLDLDVTGDIIFIDVDLKIIVKLPATASHHVIFENEAPKLKYIFDEINMNDVI